MTDEEKAQAQAFADAAKRAEESAAAESVQASPLARGTAAATAGNTPKTYAKDTPFVCVQECFVNGRRYHKGDVVTGTTCPPYFQEQPQPPVNEKPPAKTDKKK